MSIWLQKSASIQKRTSPLKFDNFAEKSEKDTVSYLSTKASDPPPAAGRAYAFGGGGGILQPVAPRAVEALVER